MPRTQKPTFPGELCRRLFLHFRLSGKETVSLRTVLRVEPAQPQAPYRPMIANPSPLNRDRKRTTRKCGEALFVSPPREVPACNPGNSLIHGTLSPSVKPDYKFESSSLRQQVSTTEKPCGSPLKIGGNARNSACFALKPDSEKVSYWVTGPALRLLSLES